MLFKALFFMNTVKYTKVYIQFSVHVNHRICELIPNVFNSDNITSRCYVSMNNGNTGAI